MEVGKVLSVARRPLFSRILTHSPSLCIFQTPSPPLLFRRCLWSLLYPLHPSSLPSSIIFPVWGFYQAFIHKDSSPDLFLGSKPQLTHAQEPSLSLGLQSSHNVSFPGPPCLGQQLLRPFWHQAGNLDSVPSPMCVSCHQAFQFHVSTSPHIHLHLILLYFSLSHLSPILTGLLAPISRTWIWLLM